MADWRPQRNRGSYDKAVTIQYRTAGESETNFPIEDWAVARSRVVMMARLQRARQDFRGIERLIPGAVQSSAEMQWEMGYCDDMDPDLVDVTKDRRLVYQGRVLDIVAAEHIGRKSAIELTTVANPSGETA